MGGPAHVGASEAEAGAHDRAVLVLLPDGTVRLFPSAASSAGLRAVDIVSQFPPLHTLSTSPSLHPTLPPDTWLTHSRTYHLVPPPKGGECNDSAIARRVSSPAGAEGGRYDLRKSATGRERRRTAPAQAHGMMAGELHSHLGNKGSLEVPSHCLGGDQEVVGASRAGPPQGREGRGVVSRQYRGIHAPWDQRAEDEPNSTMQSAEAAEMSCASKVGDPSEEGLEMGPGGIPTTGCRGEWEAEEPPALADIIAELKQRRTGIQNEILDLHRRGFLPAGLPAGTALPPVDVPGELTSQLTQSSPFDEPDEDDSPRPHPAPSVMEGRHGRAVLGPRRQSSERDWGPVSRTLSMKTLRRARQADSAAAGLKVGAGAVTLAEGGAVPGRGLREAGERAAVGRSLRHSGRDVLAKISSIVRRSASDSLEDAPPDPVAGGWSSLEHSTGSRSLRYGSRDSLARISSLVHASEAQLSHSGRPSLGTPEGFEASPFAFPYGVATSAPFLETDEFAHACFDESPKEFHLASHSLSSGISTGPSSDAVSPLSGPESARVGPLHGSPQGAGVPRLIAKVGLLSPGASTGQREGSMPQAEGKAELWARQGRWAGGASRATSRPRAWGLGAEAEGEREGEGELNRFLSLPRVQGRRPKPPPSPGAPLTLRRMFRPPPPRLPLSPDSLSLPSSATPQAKSPGPLLSPGNQMHPHARHPNPGVHPAQDKPPPESLVGAGNNKGTQVQDTTVPNTSLGYSHRGGKPPVARSPRTPPLPAGSPLIGCYASDQEEGELVRSSTVGSTMRRVRPNTLQPGPPFPLGPSKSLSRVPHATHRRTRGAPAAADREALGGWPQLQEEGEGEAGMLAAYHAGLGGAQPWQPLQGLRRESAAAVFEGATILTPQQQQAWAAQRGVPVALGNATGKAKQQSPRAQAGSISTTTAPAPAGSTSTEASLESFLHAGARPASLMQAWGTLPDSPAAPQAMEAALLA